MRSRRAWLGLLAALLTAAVLWWQQGDDTLTSEAPDSTATASSSATAAPGGVDPDSGVRIIAESALPPEALETLRLIEAGGPFPHDQDGSVFQNREALLPDRPPGHYREYTVETPGSPDRGARRIVAGATGERYWTDDHYASFSRIATDTSGG